MSNGARIRFWSYVCGLSQSETVRKEMDKLADDMTREAVEAAMKPHWPYNDKGGNFVCTICWRDYNHTNNVLLGGNS